MKTTIITREYPPYVYGGAGRHVENLSKELANLIDVEVRCFGDQNLQKGRLVVKGYKGWEKLKNQTKEKFIGALDTISTDLTIVADKIDSDIVHTHTWYASYAGYLTKILYKIPFVITCHSLEPLRPWKQEQLGNGYFLSTELEKIGIESADKIIAVSKMMKQDIIQNFNVKEDKIEVIHNGIDLNKWKPTYTDYTLKQYGINKDYILFVGRTTKQKGMIHLIDAVDHIDKSVLVVICTSGADTKEYADEVTKKVSTKKNIIFINILLKEEQYIELYSQAKVFVCPSVYEPFGIINLEAMACKKPVVATNVGGIPEVVIPDQTGILIEPEKPQQIADAVNYLLKNPDIAKKMGEKGRQRVEQFFSWSMIANYTKSLYEKILSDT